MKRQMNMCLFISMIVILIQIKFDIDINNDELLKTIWEYKKKEKKIKSSLVVHNSVTPKLKVAKFHHIILNDQCIWKSEPSEGKRNKTNSFNNSGGGI
jgi:hypothetical protein